MIIPRPKLSATSSAEYLGCQRRFWFRRIAKADFDKDWVTPKAFAFGAVFATLQERFSGHWLDLTSKDVFEECEKGGLDVNAAAQLMACLRAYIGGTIDKKDVLLKAETWLEHPTIVGKVDKVIARAGVNYIAEDKTAYELNPALEDMLATNVQACVYAANASQFDAVGLIYRVTTKPKERRKKEETWQEYTQRCKSTFHEFVLPLSHFKVEETFARMDTLAAEIYSKEGNKEAFCQNLTACKSTFGVCEFFSQCNKKVIKW
jgi:hypothetical protein